MIPSDTLRTCEATERRPSDAHTLPDLQTLRVLAKCDDGTHRFMPWYKRVCRHTPFVIQHGEIRVTDPAVRYFDLHLVRREFSRIIGERLESTLGGRRGVTVDLMH